MNYHLLLTEENRKVTFMEEIQSYYLNGDHPERLARIRSWVGLDHVTGCRAGLVSFYSVSGTMRPPPSPDHLHWAAPHWTNWFSFTFLSSVKSDNDSLRTSLIPKYMLRKLWFVFSAHLSYGLIIPAQPRLQLYDCRNTIGVCFFSVNDVGDDHQVTNIIN